MGKIIVDDTIYDCLSHCHWFNKIFFNSFSTGHFRIGYIFYFQLFQYTVSCFD